MIKVYKQNSPVFENVKDLGIYSDGRNLESYKFYGSSKQTGTPTPSSPVTVEEFGDLIPNLCTSITAGSNQVYFYMNKIKQQLTSDINRISIYAEIDIADTNISVYLSTSSGETWLRSSNITNGKIETVISLSEANINDILNSTTTVAFRMYKSGASFSTITNVMVVTGRDIMPYGTYYKIPITSNSVTNNLILTDPLRKVGNYADSVDSEGVVTRKIKKLVLDGTENWDIYSSGDTHFFYMSLSPLGLPSITYNVDPISNSFSSCKILRVSDNEQTLRCYDRSTFNSVSDFTTWLATQYANGTPVIVYYVLATAKTEYLPPYNNLFDYKTAYSTYINANGEIEGNAYSISNVTNYFTADQIGKSITVTAFAKTVLSSRVAIKTRINSVDKESNSVTQDNSGLLKITVTPTSTSDYFCLTYGSGSLNNIYSWVGLNEGNNYIPAPTIPTSSGYSNITIGTSLAPSKVELNIGEMWMNSQLYKYMENSGAIENSKEFQIYNNKNNIDNYLIEGKCSQVSTPTPSLPIEVKQVGEKTVNLYNDSTTTDGYRIYWNNGEPYADTNAATSDYISVKPETTYSLSADACIAGYDSNKTYLGVWTSSGWNKTGGAFLRQIITTNDCYYLKLIVFNKANLHNNFMFNEGSTALPYEPYGMYKIPITSNNTTQNLILTEPLRKIGSYIDTIDSNGVITRQIKKYVFNGEETWKLSSGNLFCNIIDNTAATSKTVISSHFTSTSTSGLYVSVGEYRLKLFSSSFPSGVTTAAEMQTWAATQYTNGTPLTVYYILSTPITENTSPNIIPSAAQQTLTSNGITLTSNGKGTYTLNGTSTSFTSFDLSLPSEFTIPTSISQGGNGTISFFNDFGIANCSIGFLYNEEVVDFISLDTMNKATNSYVGIGDKKVNGIRINIASDLTFSNAVISPMVSWSGNYPVNFKEYQSPVKFSSVVGNNGIVIETELEPSKFSYNLGPMWMPQRIFRYQQNAATVENSKTIPIYSNSRNLFDESQIVNDTPGNSFKTFRIQLTPNTSYTMSSNVPLYNQGALIVFAPDGTSSITTNTHGVWEGQSRTFTSPESGKMIVGYRGNSSGYDLTSYWYMINEGSTALPYEPYHKPLVSYSFEGQCSQASTPTPSSPVAVEEFGDYIPQAAIDNILNNCGVSISEPYPDLNTSGVGRVNFNASRAVETGYTLLETGLVYVKDVAVTTPLTLENVGKDGIVKNLMPAGSGTKIYHLTDPDDKGVRAVAYAVVSDGTYVIQIYSQEAKATYQELKDEQEQGITVSHLYNGPDNVTHVGEYQIPITSNNTKQFIYLPEPLRKIGDYADSMDSEGVVIRRIKKLILDGTENWQWDNGTAYLYAADALISTNALCTHFSNVSVNGNSNISIAANDFSSLSDFISFLETQYTNGTPVTVYYVLATPTTEYTHGKNMFDINKSSMITINTDTQRYGVSMGAVKAGTYTLSYTMNDANSNLFYGYRIGSTYQAGQIQTYSQASASPYTITLSQDVDDFFIRTARTNTAQNWEQQGYTNIMLNEGSTALPYEAFTNAISTIPTSSGYSNIQIGTSLAPSKFTYDLGKMFIPI